MVIFLFNITTKYTIFLEFSWSNFLPQISGTWLSRVHFVAICVDLKGIHNFC